MDRRVGHLICVAVLLAVCGASWGQEKASDPDPPDGALAVGVALLRWTSGSTAVVHDVYFGTDPNLGPDDLVQSGNPMTLYYHQPGLTPGQTYYWRVDGVAGDGTVVEGDLWFFMAQAMTAYYPSPADGSGAVPLAPDLTWLAGQGDPTHHVYFSDSEAAVADGTAEASRGIVEDPNYAPGELQPASTYYWRVDEIGPGGTELAGAVWSFTTILPIDDFESYTNEVGQRVFEVWVDGIGFSLPEPGHPGNGSGAAVGHDIWSIDSPYTTIMEPNVVHSGAQSMPLYYDNGASPYYSEAERTWATGQNWASSGVDALTLHVQGLARDFEIPRGTPVIDGEIEDLWQTASVQYVGIALEGEPDGPADSSGNFRVLYDSEYLYLVVDVNDEALVQDSDPAQGWLDDRIEVFIDGDNSKDAAQDGQNDYQYCFRWNHGAVETPVEWYRSPGSLAGVEYAVVTTDSGYLFEIKLPWSTMIGGPPEEGQLIGMDVMIGDDDDGGNRDTQITWHLTEGSPHTPSMWGTALVAEAAPADGGDLVYVALRDAFNRTAVVANPDPNVVKASDWVEWKISLSEFADAGVDLASVIKMCIGVGDRDVPKPGAGGLIFVDDIYLTKPTPVEEPNDITGQ